MEKVVGSPPQRIDRVPLWAPISPPVTGQSRELIHCLIHSLYISLARDGSLVV